MTKSMAELTEDMNKRIKAFWLDGLTYTDNLGHELTAYEYDGEILVTHNDEAALLLPLPWIRRNGKQIVERWVGHMHNGVSLDGDLAWAEERGRKAFSNLRSFGGVSTTNGHPMLEWEEVSRLSSDLYVPPADENMKSAMDSLSEYQSQKLHDALTNPDVETNAQGGRQSASDYFLRGLPPLALLRIGRILKEGAAKYEPDPFGDVTQRNWHRITANEHLEHALTHMIKLLMGRDDEYEDHAGHFATRALFFLHQYIQERDQTA
jgi:hypothetical protein